MERTPSVRVPTASHHDGSSDSHHSSAHCGERFVENGFVEVTDVVLDGGDGHYKMDELLRWRSLRLIKGPRMVDHYLSIYPTG